MRNVRVLSIHNRPWLAHQCTFVEKIAQFNISHFYVIKINHRAQMIIDIAEFAPKELFFIIEPLSQCQNITVSMVKLPWQPQMHGQPLLYNNLSNTKFMTIHSIWSSINWWYRLSKIKQFITHGSAIRLYVIPIPILEINAFLNVEKQIQSIRLHKMRVANFTEQAQPVSLV